MEVKNKRMYLKLTGFTYLISFLLFAIDMWNISQQEIVFNIQRSRIFRIIIMGTLGAYVMASVATGVVLTMEFLHKKNKKIKIAAAMLFFITIYISTIIGIVALVPCYSYNLKKYREEKEVLKWKKNKFCAVGVGLGGLLVAFFCFMSFSERGIHNVKIEKVAELGKSGQWETEETDMVYCKKVYDAVWKMAKKSIEDAEAPLEENKIIQLENEKYVFGIWISETVEGKMCLESFFIEKHRSLYSYPIWVQIQTINGMLKSRRSYDVKDEIVRDILISREASEITEKVNNENMFLWGAGTDEGLKDLTIIGQKPDRVMPVAYGDETVYFWYYMNGNEIKELLENEPEFENMTMEETAEFLEIKIKEKS